MEPTNHKGTKHQVERVLDKISSIVSLSLISIALGALVVWVGVMVAFIVGRTIFNTNWTFVEEFTIYLMVLVSFFAFPYAVRSGAHISVDVVIRVLPKRAKDILLVVTNLLCLAVVGYLVQKGLLWFLSGVETGVRSQFTSNVMLWPVYLLVPIGLVAMGLTLLLELYRSVIEVVEYRGKR